MSEATLQLPAYAIQLTQAFQTNIHPSSEPKHGPENVGLIFTTLIRDERKGERLVESEGQQIIVAELFKRSWKDFTIRRALQQKTQAVKLAPENISDLKFISSYLGSYRFPAEGRTLPAVYLLSIATARELYAKTNQTSVIEVCQMVKNQPQKHQIWLVA